MTRIYLQDAKATREFGINLAKTLKPGTVILLQGDLGAGKTTLVQAIGEGLGISDPIVSPTFTLINEYTDGILPLYHLDLYRLEPQDVANLYLENYWEGIDTTPGIVAIEWTERMPYLPHSYLKLILTYEKDNSRYVEIISSDYLDK
ncbi:tRNA (adenosine(37)-N6)-threonylcarbamoyltransferase complex ATPase subunit type 1 TsaE [Cylindrospermopsis raciborskii S07]|uniref:tRNA (adenosine(37)-N6)-threonylcarbamoyltransferase complex ATPase subunit type 1 TsaE n=1 Tax=Cylindrospermopsis raciborskii TaxID=77022 RepID=UPI000C9E075E|nr:tRNA (adenosine(37)-N6)-threonylcarbamoyltransferase complex ATPase subunit type 1 TsaE [Cylindrospermopsis raciborskii]PNK01923.1 tRNA (adenosine(37)-N6)-threonylcarbamoyltransferase complex ATPase subunit type 1 TsaE [Cylindrospermopsis raciborskii S07]PNK05737.1 tRNA (adenosine(37)-N6)-threonylcarbamoyltransferase complex ATPase subunit type 1 TsaE [Cylindrospermopsis raciborskii S14]PNK06443.1 tRNA (adenosine(37)-N6)-threonylcarbamoyltransferase complex ATPase subunit type 1 TsaE [Cylindr